MYICIMYIYICIICVYIYYDQKQAVGVLLAMAFSLGKQGRPDPIWAAVGVNLDKRGRGKHGGFSHPSSGGTVPLPFIAASAVSSVAVAPL